LLRRAIASPRGQGAAAKTTSATVRGELPKYVEAEKDVSNDEALQPHEQIRRFYLRCVIQSCVSEIIAADADIERDRKLQDQRIRKRERRILIFDARHAFAQRLLAASLRKTGAAPRDVDRDIDDLVRRLGFGLAAAFLGGRGCLRTARCRWTATTSRTAEQHGNTKWFAGAVRTDALEMGSRCEERSDHCRPHDGMRSKGSQDSMHDEIVAQSPQNTIPIDVVTALQMAFSLRLGKLRSEFDD
jgi:hypothetical protein